MVSVVKNKEVETWELTCVELEADGSVPFMSKVPGTDEIKDKALVGYGLEDNQGTAYAPIEPMIEAYERGLLLPAEEGSKKGKRKKKCFLYEWAHFWSILT